MVSISPVETLVGGVDLHTSGCFEMLKRDGTIIGDICGDTVVAIFEECPIKRRTVDEVSVMFPKGFIELS